MKVAFVHNFNNYYRAPVFDALAEQPGFDVDFFFFSKGAEAYWMKEHGVEASSLRHIYLSGFELGGTRVTPSIFWHLLKRRYDVYVKCINGRFALPATYIVARLRRKPFVLWTEVWMNYRTRGHRIGRLFVTRIYRRADAIVACGNHVRDFLVQEGVDPGRIVVVGQAVDNVQYGRPVDEAAKANLRASLGIDADRPIVLFVGRFTEVKGLPHLFHAFADLIKRGRDHKAVLCMVGVGEDGDALRQLAERLDIAERVVWAGYVPPIRIPAYYAAAAVLALPSVELDHIKETWGLVVNEAFNQGLPVIATEAVGAAAGGLVEDGRTGRVVPHSDPAALGEALHDLLSDPGRREKMARACRAEIGRYTQRGMAEGIAVALRRVVPAAGGSAAPACLGRDPEAR